MSFNIEEFLHNALPLGGARPTLFNVTIASPFGSPNDGKWEFLCRAASVPPATLDIIRVPYFGRNVKYAGDRDFPDWGTTIYNDEDFPLRVLIEKWSNSINAMLSNRMDPTQDSLVFYKTVANVREFGKAGDLLRAYDLWGIWPVNVDAMRLDWGEQNRLQEFEVVWAYDYWTPNDQGTTTASSADQYSGLWEGEGVESAAVPPTQTIPTT